MSVTIGLTKFKTFSDENQFEFVCPLFNAQTKMRSCMALREGVWMGKPIEKRRGCQAAMHANKCPIDRICKRVGDQNYGDPYGSDTPKVGSLRKDDLQRMLPVVCDQRMMERHGASQAEIQLMESANERIQKALGASRTSATEILDDDVEVKPTRRAAPAPKAAKPTTLATNTNNDAALRGDISAALNAAA